eukprot:s2743_g6.t2
MIVSREVENTKAVSVTLAGDEQRVLRQAPSGSILLSVGNKDRVQTIVRFGAVIDCLGCTLKWSKGGSRDIADLEMKKVEELKQRAEGLQQRLNALRVMEVKQEDWRNSLAAYAQEGCESEEAEPEGGVGDIGFGEYEPSEPEEVEADPSMKFNVEEL